MKNLKILSCKKVKCFSFTLPLHGTSFIGIDRNSLFPCNNLGFPPQKTFSVGLLSTDKTCQNIKHFNCNKTRQDSTK